MINWLSPGAYSYQSQPLSTDPNNVITPILTIPSLPSSTDLPTVYAPIVVFKGSSSTTF